MINFLQDPSHFNLETIKLSSVKNRETLYKIASHQLKSAKTFKEAKNFLVNLIQSGIAKIVDFKNLVLSVFHKLTKFIFISTPIVSHFTSFFRTTAYQRLLEGMYDSWKLGALDRKKGYKQRTAGEVVDYLVSKVQNPKFKKLTSQLAGSGWRTAPFYDEYLLGFNGGQPSELKQRAVEVAKRDIGSRTMSEMLKYMHDMINPFRDVYNIMKMDKNDVEIRPFIGIFVKMCFMISKFSMAVFLYSKVAPVLAIAGLFYYNPREAFLKENKTWVIFKRKIFNSVDMYVDGVDLDGYIPAKSVFVEDAMDEYKGLSKTRPKRYTKD